MNTSPNSIHAVRPRKLLASLVLLSAALSSTVWAQQQPQAREVLGPGDSVRISVFQNPDLTTDARVSEKGTISFPLIGEVSVKGLTPAQAETQIAQSLVRGKYVLKPQVTLNLMQVRSRQVSVLGQVARPGRYPLDDSNAARLTDILALAGGITPTGDDTVSILTTRHGKPETIEVNVPVIYQSGDMTRDITIESGDRIFVQRAPQFYIQGEVQRPGSYRLEPSMTVMQALSAGGGLTPRGTQRGMKVQRRHGNVLQTIELGPNDRLQPDDVIVVKESLF